MSVLRGNPPVTVDRVLEELRTHFPGQWVRAVDLQMERGANVGIRGSIQAISNALRHGHHQGVIRRRESGSRNTSEWTAR